jgi:hypothetical protein
LVGADEAPLVHGLLSVGKSHGVADVEQLKTIQSNNIVETNTVLDYVSMLIK